MSDNIQHIMKHHSIYTDRAMHWRSWYNNSFIYNVAKNHRDLKGEGIDLTLILDSMVGPDGWTAEATRKSKGLIQRKILVAIKNHNIPDPQYRLRNKIRRWYPKDKEHCYHPQAQPNYALAGPERHVAARISATLNRLQSVVAPRVCAAVFKFLWNGWVTKARFQGREDPDCLCVLGCVSDGRPNAADAQNHYCHCPTVHAVWKSRLRTTVSMERSLFTWLLANPELENNDMLSSTAIIIYSTMRAINHYRHVGPTDRITASQFMNQAISQGVRGHSKSAAFVNGLWDLTNRPEGLCLSNGR